MQKYNRQNTEILCRANALHHSQIKTSQAKAVKVCAGSMEREGCVPL